jgi:mRNA interferase RelE/StbE
VNHQRAHDVGVCAAASLRAYLAGLHSARVGAYRIVYEIDEGSRAVRVISIDNRADVYRPR